MPLSPSALNDNQSLGCSASRKVHHRLLRHLNRYCRSQVHDLDHCKSHQLESNPTLACQWYSMHNCHHLVEKYANDWNRLLMRCCLLANRNHLRKFHFGLLYDRYMGSEPTKVCWQRPSLPLDHATMRLEYVPRRRCLTHHHRDRRPLLQYFLGKQYHRAEYRRHRRYCGRSLESIR